MQSALNKLAEEDPTFKMNQNEETGQVIISGMGELHLQVMAERASREFSVLLRMGKPSVAYRETIEERKSGKGKFIRQSGGISSGIFPQGRLSTRLKQAGGGRSG